MTVTVDALAKKLSTRFSARENGKNEVLAETEPVPECWTFRPFKGLFCTNNKIWE